MAPKSAQKAVANVKNEKPKGKAGKRGKKSTESWKIYIYKVHKRFPTRVHELRHLCCGIVICDSLSLTDSNTWCKFYGSDAGRSISTFEMSTASSV
jgi:hypothetical protein